MKLNVNFRLQMIIMCQSRFISCNKYTAMVGDVDNAGVIQWNAR